MHFCFWQKTTRFDLPYIVSFPESFRIATSKSKSMLNIDIIFKKHQLFTSNIYIYIYNIYMDYMSFSNIFQPSHHFSRGFPPCSIPAPPWGVPTEVLHPRNGDAWLRLHGESSWRSQGHVGFRGVQRPLPTWKTREHRIEAGVGFLQLCTWWLHQKSPFYTVIYSILCLWSMMFWRLLQDVKMPKKNFCNSATSAWYKYIDITYILHTHTYIYIYI